MKISRVQAHLLSYPLPQPLKLDYHGGERCLVKRDAMLIRVEADNGLIGYAPGQATESAKERIDSIISRFLEDRILSDPDALRVHFWEGPGRDVELQRLYSTVEIALYDLAGKAKGVSVSEMLGGRTRDRIRLYASAGMQMMPEMCAAQAHAISEFGFRAYKMRAGIDPDQDLEIVQRVREALGADFDLMVDAQSWWCMGDRKYLPGAIEKLAEEFGALDIAWLEDPLPPSDREAYQRLKELDFVPLAAGVHELEEPGFLDLISSGNVDCVQMHLVSQGAYPTARRLLAEISRAGLKFAFHCGGTALDVVAAAHLGICWPGQVCEWIEYPCYSSPAATYPFPLAAEVLKEPLRLDHGDLIVPNGPGLGVEIDESVIERYPWIPGERSFPGMAALREALAVDAGPQLEKTPGKPVGEEARSRARRPA